MNYLKSYYLNQYCRRCQVIAKLTSSKNERIAMLIIWDATLGHLKASSLILNREFERAGIAGRKSINLAVNRLIRRGLVRKFKELIHNHDHDVYRYSVNFRGVVTFLNQQPGRHAA